jgi:alkylation response protein AidB-like acyl-CoA dehydrogenase
MRAGTGAADAALIARQIEATPGLERLRGIDGGCAAATPETVLAVLAEAARFAATVLEPFGAVADRAGCTLTQGRVRTAPGHRAAWDAFVAGGWTTLDGDPAQGGQGLPLALAVAVQEVMDRACPAFNMLAVPQRSAARLIGAYGDAAMRTAWLPRLIEGAWAATICISEPEAGSDLSRIRTRAARDADGRWLITGEKCWISFGDHDLAPRIGHCVLARTQAADDRLSLFLVPDWLDGARNGVVVRRVEEKLGLHASPTCALGFEGAVGALIGAEGRGLQQMFVMIANMRLATAAEGLGIAAGAADVALAYAQQRRQGRIDGQPVAIAAHADVQRMLLGMAARVEVLRGLVLSAAVAADLARLEPDPAARVDQAALLQFLLPIVKTLGGEWGFEVASEAMQVLGGAGYTRDWPVEQMLRDARILSILEGTTGIQALDLMQRRVLRDDPAGYRVFMAAARASRGGAALELCLDLLEEAVAWLTAHAADQTGGRRPDGWRPGWRVCRATTRRRGGCAARGGIG